MRSLIALAILTGFLTACSGSENLTVSTTSNNTLLIPSTATSCLAKYQAASGTTATADITSAYFRLPHITFTKQNINNNMYISQVKITMTLPNSTSDYSCVIAGDALSALYTVWRNNDASTPATFTDSVIASGTQAVTTDCPLYRGGITSDTSFSTTATMEVDGYEQAPNSDDQTPVRTTTFFTVTNQ